MPPGAVNAHATSIAVITLHDERARKSSVFRIGSRRVSLPIDFTAKFVKQQPCDQRSEIGPASLLLIDAEEYTQEVASALNDDTAATGTSSELEQESVAVGEQWSSSTYLLIPNPVCLGIESDSLSS